MTPCESRTKQYEQLCVMSHHLCFEKEGESGSGRTNHNEKDATTPFSMSPSPTSRTRAGGMCERLIHSLALSSNLHLEYEYPSRIFIWDVHNHVGYQSGISHTSGTSMWDVYRRHPTSRLASLWVLWWGFRSM